jgi:hypothetical protein
MLSVHSNTLISLASAVAISCLLLSASCKRKHTVEAEFVHVENQDTISVTRLDTIAIAPVDTLKDEEFSFDESDSAFDVLKSMPNAERYMSGIYPSIAKYAPEYLAKLLNSTYSKFIVVDKSRMKVLLYDSYGHLLRSYGMACSKQYGTKLKKADNRTPEGFFSVEGVYDSKDWLFTDDDGKTSDKKGQFGPKFIRLSVPNTTQIGIHGTCAPWSIGSRSSHGCIRVTNENILELVGFVEVGMPVIVLPGKKDRSVNESEGSCIAYFPTSPQYTLSKSELAKYNKENNRLNAEKDSMKSEDSNLENEHLSEESSASILPDSI